MKVWTTLRLRIEECTKKRVSGHGLPFEVKNGTDRAEEIHPVKSASWGLYGKRGLVTT